MVASPVLLLLFVGAISAAPVVQDDWKEIVKDGAEVAGNAAKVAIDIAKIIGDVGGKREVEDNLADLVAAIEAKVTEVIDGALKVFGDVESKQREVEDTNWGSLVVDGASAVKDVVDLGESIGKLVSDIKG